MSNKTILQTNNTNLASYTDRVNALITKANNLPEAGGSVEDITSEITTQDTLLTELENILANKAAGEGSVETCTVNINTYGYNIYCITYVTVDESSNVISACITPNSTNTQVLTCLAGSYIAIHHALDTNVPELNISGATIVRNVNNFLCLKLTNTLAKIHISNDIAGGTID